LSGYPQIERKEKLQTLLVKSRVGNHLNYSEHVTGNGAAILKKACGLGLEDVVSKLATAPYRPGRQKTWLKSKCLMRQEIRHRRLQRGEVGQSRDRRALS
jgi:bifunctional non-homologous end joining protein LigD